MATGSTSEHNIPYPLPTDSVDVANDIKLLAEKIDQLLNSVPQAVVNEVTNELFQIIPLDDMSYYFDGVQDTFEPRYNSVKVPVSNPYRVILTIEGHIQSPNFEDYVNLAPPIMQHGFVLTSNGDFKFLSIPQSGQKFDARIMPGAIENEKARKYPFSPVSLMMGDN